jgi:hypothetical protein
MPGLRQSAEGAILLETREITPVAKQKISRSPRNVVGEGHPQRSWPRKLVAYAEAEGRSMPSFFILLRSVLGWRFRILAAPRGPSMTPQVCRNT